MNKDNDVMFRGRKVGRIWLFDYTGKLGGERDAPTLEAAMAGFRAAWDAPGANVRNIT
jgi:hypothetical protein